MSYIVSNNILDYTIFQYIFFHIELSILREDISNYDRNTIQAGKNMVADVNSVIGYGKYLYAKIDEDWGKEYIENKYFDTTLEKNSKGDGDRLENSELSDLYMEGMGERIDVIVDSATNDITFWITEARWGWIGEGEKQLRLNILGDTQLRALEFDSGIPLNIRIEEDEDYGLAGVYDPNKGNIEIYKTYNYDESNNYNNFTSIFDTLTHELVHKVQYEGVVKGIDEKWVGSSGITKRDKELMTCSYDYNRCNDKDKEFYYHKYIVDGKFDRDEFYKNDLAEYEAFYIGNNVREDLLKEINTSK